LATLPFHVVAVIVALPLAMPLTTPLGDTVAIFLLLVVHVIVFGLVVVGVHVFTFTATVLPLFIFAAVLSSVILVAPTVPTVKTNFCVFDPALTVIVAFPAFNAVITPVLSIVATAVLLDLYVGTIPVAFAGLSFGLTCNVLPGNSPVGLLGVIVNDFNAVALATTYTVHVAFLLPSFQVTVIFALPFV